MHHPTIVDALTQVIGPDVKAMQTMLFIKSEGKPGQAWHQDEHFIPTRDRSLAGVWIALDDATIENGCLWVLPGSHAPGVLYPDRELDDERFDKLVARLHTDAAPTARLVELMRG
jgi:ectoine hydroxylase-related dioxygenase (phytanoyl-CoA dioxygenase family)